MDFRPSKPRKHHFVPQFYLRGFYDDQNKLHVFDRQHKWYKAYDSSKGIAYQVGYYFVETDEDQESVQIEDMLSKFETKAQPVLEKLAREENITRDERVDAAAFIALQSQRVPHIEKRIREATEKMYIALAKESAKRGFFGRQAVEHGAFRNGLFTKPEEIDAEVIRTIEEGRLKFTEHKNNVIDLMMKSAADLQVGFFNSSWVILHAPRGASFISSDNPVANTGGGALTEESVKVFPLNPRSALMIGPTGGKPSNGHKDISTEHVKKINNMIAEQSDRYVIGHNQALIKRVVKRTKVDEYQIETRAEVKFVEKPGNPDEGLFIIEAIGPDVAA